MSYARIPLRCDAAVSPARFLPGCLGVMLLGLQMIPPAVAGDARLHLADLSLEQLVNIEITSVSKKETSLFRSPAAIAVVTSDDIRRLGATRYPEALRGVPGLSVAQIDQNMWAIGSRGFASQYTDKLLVLQDGRSLYTPGFSGVFWDAHDTVLDDVDRIEVIRGPGATLWGSNAVNGVINIITRSAMETQGGLVAIGGGPGEGREAAIRYGGRAGSEVYYRVYLKHFDRDPMVNATGDDLAQNWEALRGGLRLDWQATEYDLVTFQADASHTDLRETLRRPVFVPPYYVPETITGESQNVNLLGRWTRTLSDVSEFSIQTYLDTGWHEGLGTLEYRDTFDLEVQHRFAWQDQHDVVWGAGYRTSSDDIRPSPYLIWNPQRKTLELATAFVQDEITLVADRLKLTLGSKFEHNDITGLEVQPNVRMLWTPTRNQTVWSAVTRAVRTPSRYNTDVLNSAGIVDIIPGLPPAEIVVRGNPDLKSEVMWAYEIGYRAELGSRLSVDLAVFHNDYDRLIGGVELPLEFVLEPVPHAVMPMILGNGFKGRACGGEVALQWVPADGWRLRGTFALQDVHTTGAWLASMDDTSSQAGVQSFLDLPFGLEQTVALTWVSDTPAAFAGLPGVPAYTRLDLGLTWRASESLEFGLWGRNLLEARHAESFTPFTVEAPHVPRSFLGRMTWRF